MKAQTLFDLLPTELEISLMTEQGIMSLIKTHQNIETSKTRSKERVVCTFASSSADPRIAL